jgi:hypothetical protein
MKPVKIIAIALVCIIASPAIAQAGPLQRRIDRQENRIDHGVDNGSLNNQEEERLEDRLDRIEDFREGQIEDGNGLNPLEAWRINHRLNQESKAIYRQKND